MVFTSSIAIQNPVIFEAFFSARLWNVETLIVALIRSKNIFVYTNSNTVQSQVIIEAFSFARLWNVVTLIVALVKSWIMRSFTCSISIARLWIVETLIVALMKSCTNIICASSITVHTPVSTKAFSFASLWNVETLIVTLIKSWIIWVFTSSIAVDFQGVSSTTSIARNVQGLTLNSTEPCSFFYIFTREKPP